MAVSDIKRLIIFSYLMIKVSSTNIHTNITREYKTYHCQSGIYVSNKIVCGSHHNKFCGDPMDNFIGCDKNCAPGKFKCIEDANSTCLDITARCNTIKDCLNGSDELNCGSETEVNECHFHEGKFLCEDKLKCLDLEYTCDGFCNCFDCSDENSNCTKTENSSNEKCPISHFSTPMGPQCLCDPSNKQLDELCQKVEDCSHSEYICSQRCLKYKSKISCSCYDNYVQVSGSNGTRCHSNISNADTLLYSTSSKIKALNMNSFQASILLNRVECASLTAAHNYLYFTKYDDNQRVIHVSEIGSLSSSPLIIWNSTITSIAVDYITTNIYFTVNGSLLVCSNDNIIICKKIKCCELDHIALAPKSGLMFYTTKTTRNNERFVIKSGMDGSNEEILVDSSFHDPRTLTVDELAEKLYWINHADGRSEIYSASFNEFVKRHDLIIGEGNETHIAVYQKNIYFTKKRKYFISRIEPTMTTAHVKFYKDVYTSSVELLFPYNPSQQGISKVDNPCNVTSCPKNLCLLRPKSPSSTVFEHNCV